MFFFKFLLLIKLYFKNFVLGFRIFIFLFDLCSYFFGYLGFKMYLLIFFMFFFNMFVLDKNLLLLLVFFLLKLRRFVRMNK